MSTRAEWIVRQAADMSRAGVGDVGGLTPLMKIVHLCESFGMTLEMHSPGAANLARPLRHELPWRVLRAWPAAPLRRLREAEPLAEYIEDPLDADGYVHVSQLPGLGQDINFDFIKENTIQITGEVCTMATAHRVRSSMPATTPVLSPMPVAGLTALTSMP